MSKRREIGRKEGKKEGRKEGRKERMLMDSQNKLKMNKKITSRLDDIKDSRTVSHTKSMQ